MFQGAEATPMELSFTGTKVPVTHRTTSGSKAALCVIIIGIFTN